MLSYIMSSRKATVSLCFISCGVLPAGLIEQRDSQPLLKLIDSIGDWPVASDDWNTTTGRDIRVAHHALLCANMQTCTCSTSTQNERPRSSSNTRAHAETHAAIFALGELLSTSLVGGIKRPAEALQLSSQVWSLGA